MACAATNYFATDTYVFQPQFCFYYAARLAATLDVHAVPDCIEVVMAVVTPMFTSSTAPAATAAVAPVAASAVPPGVCPATSDV